MNIIKKLINRHNILQTSIKLKEKFPHITIVLLIDNIKGDTTDLASTEFFDYIIGLPLIYKNYKKVLKKIFKIKSGFSLRRLKDLFS